MAVSAKKRMDRLLSNPPDFKLRIMTPLVFLSCLDSDHRMNGARVAQYDAKTETV